ncbi:hypothetical protein LRN87_26025, partial [Escherichia coli]|uniref:hypothetical protein n=1 Tax=Escherichia coli TaxID=562 RepID=UPI001F418EB5
LVQGVVGQDAAAIMKGGAGVTMAGNGNASGVGNNNNNNVSINIESAALFGTALNGNGPALAAPDAGNNNN